MWWREKARRVISWDLRGERALHARQPAELQPKLAVRSADFGARIPLVFSSSSSEFKLFLRNFRLWLRCLTDRKYFSAYVLLHSASVDASTFKHEYFHRYFYSSASKIFMTTFPRKKKKKKIIVLSNIDTLFQLSFQSIRSAIFNVHFTILTFTEASEKTNRQIYCAEVRNKTRATPWLAKRRRSAPNPKWTASSCSSCKCWNAIHEPAWRGWPKRPVNAGVTCRARSAASTSCALGGAVETAELRISNVRARVRNRSISRSLSLFYSPGILFFSYF